MKIGAIIQARMGSTRLPGKVMKLIEGKTVLAHVVDRVKQSNLIDMIIVATTIQNKDDIIEEEAIRNGVGIFRGNEEDVLSRYYYAAKENNLDVIVRITSDCPLIDPNIIDKMIDFYLEGNYDVVSNAGAESSNRTYPRGLDTEVFSWNALNNAFHNAEEPYQREHVTPYMYEHLQKICYFKNRVDYSKYRWTLDTDDDFKLISTIYKYMYKDKEYFYLDDILKLYDQHPELYNINSHIEQKKIK